MAYSPVRVVYLIGGLSGALTTMRGDQASLASCSGLAGDRNGVRRNLHGVLHALRCIEQAGSLANFSIYAVTKTGVYFLTTDLSGSSAQTGATRLINY
jgi:uncharacterized membrane protein